MLHPDIELPEKADTKLVAMQNAAQTALQSMRFSRDQVAMFKRSLELDPTEPEERKARLASAELSMEQHGKRHAELQKKLTAIHDRSHAIVRNSVRKALQLPPLAACEVDESHDDPFRWLGVAVGKSMPKKTRQQRRAEYERDPNPRPDEHPLSYAARMKRVNGPREPRVRIEMPIGDQYMAGLESAAAANER